MQVWTVGGTRGTELWTPNLLKVQTGLYQCAKFQIICRDLAEIKKTVDPPEILCIILEGHVDLLRLKYIIFRAAFCFPCSLKHQ